MKMNGKYQTSDLYLAACLLSMGLGLLDVDHRDQRRCKFVFADREDRAEFVHSFMVGRAVGNLADFIFHLRRAKRALYSTDV